MSLKKPIHNSQSTTHHSFLTAALLLSVCCGAAPKSSTPAPDPAAGPTVVLPSGARYRVELAHTPEEQAQGLMFREALPPNAGMLFLFPEPGIHKFWMKNTMIALDIIWMDSTGKVVFVSANTPQCRADPCPTFGPDQPASNVLEIAGGMAKKERVEVGAVIRFVDVK